ncbi:MAG: hypothetical protein MUC36_20255 [Planctomycetes bacterium]|nr:hypothetical protein [Planctomycetota bacterium]
MFAILMDGDDEATEELNRFLRGQKVLSVEKVGVVDQGRHYRSICVEYLTRRVGEIEDPRLPARLLVPSAAHQFAA